MQMHTSFSRASFWEALLILLVSIGASPAGFAEDEDSVTRTALRQAIVAAEAEAKPATLGRDQFVHGSNILNVRLSPSGRDLAVLKHRDGRFDAVVVSLTERNELKLLSGAAGIAMDWASDGQGLWLADDHGLSWFDAETRGARRIYRWPVRKRQSFFGVDEHAPGHALLREAPAPGTLEGFRYWLLDRSGKVSLLHHSKSELSQILLREGPSLAFSSQFDLATSDTAVRQHGALGNREIFRCRGVEICRLIGSSHNGDTLWLKGQRAEDLLSLQQWRSADNRLSTLHRDPKGLSDLDALLWSRGGPIAVAYDHGRRYWEPVERSAGPALQTLQKRLPNAALNLSASNDSSLWLVRAEHERWVDDRYYLYTPRSNRLDRLFVPIPEPHISEAELAAMVPLSYRSGDGALLQGYVLLPAGRKLDQVPLIAWIHGGPTTREYARFVPPFQFLANRGYAVFIPNFRGSDGFGIRYKLEGNGDVGDGRVLADVLDGLDFLLDQGIGNRDKQAVMGHSFGGYLSLVAGTHRPDRFAYLYAGAAPTDYGWMKQWQAEHDSDSTRGGPVPLSVIFPLFRYPYLDPIWREKMRNESPRQNAHKVRVPVYLWAGAKDGRVPLASLGHYASELRRLGKPVVMVIDPDAGHSTESRLSSEAYLFMMEAASHRAFGGDLLPPSEELKAFFNRNARLNTDMLKASEAAVRTH